MSVLMHLLGTWFHTLDLAFGYWQIAIEPADRHKTAFLTKYGLFEHVHMAQGLCNAPATFQRAMHVVLIVWNKALVYSDDVIVLRKSFENALTNLELVLPTPTTAQLEVKASQLYIFLNRSSLSWAQDISSRSLVDR